MIRIAAAVLLLSLCAPVSAQCNKIDAKFENMTVGTMLSLIAEEVGLKLMNPELAPGVANTSFKEEAPIALLAKVAWSEGFELRVKGNEVWLEKREQRTAGI